MDQEKLYARFLDLYFITRRNKRYGRDAMNFEACWTPRLVRLFREHIDRIFRINHNYAFLVSLPRWREIFATEFAGRLADHVLCDALSPYVEKALSPRTYNNRVGKGAQAAINQVIEDMTEVSWGYTRDAYVIKLDFKGYFPNALWSYAEQCICRVIEDNREDIAKEYGSEAPNYLRWLAMVCINANPAEHFERRTPLKYWKEYIDPEKSIITKEPGVGAAIGRLTWQMSMGLYVNDEIKWLNEDCGLHVVCFVDDIVIQVPARLKGYALSLIPELRKRLAVKNVFLNEKKFYCQPYGHGLEFLGSHIKPMRVHLNNKCYGGALEKISHFNKLEKKYAALDEFLASINSYTGLLKNRTEHKRMEKIRDAIGKDWYQFVKWNDKKQCLTFRRRHDMKHRLNRKYKLRLKLKDNEQQQKERPLHRAHGAKLKVS